MDQRDSPTWVAIELTRQGEEKVQDGSLADTLRADLGVSKDFEIFVPAATYPRGHRRVTLLLMEGYVFVATGLPETRYFALEDRPYIGQVMSTVGGHHRMRTVTSIPDRVVADLRHQLRKMVTANLPLGTRVRVLDGAYRNLEGIVRGTDDEHAFVEICLRSLELVATIPSVLLEALEPVAKECKGG